MHFITRMYSPSLYITTCHARDGVSDTPEHSDDIYLPSSSLIGDTDTVAWLRAARCTGTGRHRASQAAIACTASLHRTPPFQAAKSKAFLIISGRGAAVALVAARRDLDPSHLRAPHTLMLGRRPPHAQGPCACGAVLGFVRRPPCGERQGSRIKSARASRRRGVKRDRIRCPSTRGPHGRGSRGNVGTRARVPRPRAAWPSSEGEARRPCPDGTPSKNSGQRPRLNRGSDVC